METERSLPHSEMPANAPYTEPKCQSRYQAYVWTFSNMIHFYGEELLAPRPNPKVKNHPFSVVRDCFFHLFAATLHVGGGSSIRNLRTSHAVVTPRLQSSSSPNCILNWLRIL
jgi:hypothetical protein